MLELYQTSFGARFALYFGYDDPALDKDLSATVKLYKDEQYKQFVAGCLEENIYMNYAGFQPFPHHSGFGIAHTDGDIAETLVRMDRIFANLKEKM